MDKEVPTSESQIPDLSCFIIQDPSVPLQTLGFRTEKLQNLTPTKLLGNSQGNETWSGSYKVCSGLTFPPHKCGFREKDLMVIVQRRDLRQEQLVLPGEPVMSSPGKTGGAVVLLTSRSAFSKGVEECALTGMGQMLTDLDPGLCGV